MSKDVFRFEESLKVINEQKIIIEKLKLELLSTKVPLIKDNENTVAITESFVFTTIPEAIENFKKGEFLIVLDDETRENEGDLIIAAEFITPEKMAFMINHTSGIVCVAITQEKQKKLSLPMMVEINTEKHQTAFTQSVDVKGTTTGVSATDRVKTILSLTDDSIGLDMYHRPGHVFPLVSKSSLKERQGHTEATIELCKLANLKKIGCLSEIALKNGEMARLDHLKGFSKLHGINIITIKELCNYITTLGN